MSRTKVSVIALLLILASGGACLYWFVTAHSFSAREKPLAIEAFVARNLRHLALPPGVGNMKNSVNMTPLATAVARDHFADHCATCHNNNGDGKTMINEGLYPPAPDLREAQTQNMSDGELFYIIKNGIRFTGMPGWGGHDEENWKLVGFIRHLPKLSEKELQLMKEINSMEMPSEGGLHEH